MIKIEVLGNNDKITIIGHAEYAEKGKDIVCASVSSIVITTVNGILRLDSKAIIYNEDDGIIIDVINKSEVVDKLIINMIELLEELVKQYPKYINIRRCL